MLTVDYGGGGGLAVDYLINSFFHFFLLEYIPIRKI